MLVRSEGRHDPGGIVGFIGPGTVFACAYCGTDKREKFVSDLRQLFFYLRFFQHEGHWHVLKKPFVCVDCATSTPLACCHLCEKKEEPSKFRYWNAKLEGGIIMKWNGKIVARKQKGKCPLEMKKALLCRTCCTKLVK